MSFSEEKIDEVFINSVNETFANMAFIDVSFKNDFDGDVPFTSLMGLDMKKPVSGTIQFGMSRECKKKIVENIYGENWKTLSDLEIDDCLLEILNVLCGDFLKNLIGGEVKVNMSFPRLFFEDEEISEPSVREFVFDAEGALFKGRLIINS